MKKTPLGRSVGLPGVLSLRTVSREGKGPGFVPRFETTFKEYLSTHVCVSACVGQESSSIKRLPEMWSSVSTC